MFGIFGTAAIIEFCFTRNHLCESFQCLEIGFVVSLFLRFGTNHRLNMELDLQSLYGHSCTHWLRPRKPPPPPFGLIYEVAIGQPS
jgi:hypothetical protein